MPTISDTISKAKVGTVLEVEYHGGDKKPRFYEGRVRSRRLGENRVPSWVDFEERNCFITSFGKAGWGFNPDIYHCEEGVPMSIEDLYRVDDVRILD